MRLPPGSARQLPVLLAAATGVPQGYYVRFVDWLRERGYDVLTFDYRGIGASLHGPLRGHRATLAQWGQQDLVAALDALLARTGQSQAVLLGHSAGGQMTGIMPNHQRIARVVGVSCSSGWFAGMPLRFRIVATAVMRGLIPLGVRLKGYGPCKLFGLGEDLPAQVALQWGQWCAAGGYAINAVKQAAHLDFHPRVRCPIHVLHAADDNIATPRTVADLLRLYPAASVSSQQIHARDFGLHAIGHIDWFRNSHRALWPLIAQAIEAPSA